MRISDGTLVKISYQAHLDSGEVVDRVDADQALGFVYGQNQLLPGLEQALAGLQTGDRIAVVVSGDQVFGSATEEKLRLENWDQFLHPAEISPGVLYRRNTRSGMQTVRVISFDSQGVWLDCAPWEGKQLIFDIEILEVTKKARDRKPATSAARPCAHGCTCVLKGAEGKDNFCQLRQAESVSIQRHEADSGRH